MLAPVRKHWRRLKRSLGRRWREWWLPRGYVRLGTRYGGWWINRLQVSADPLMIDCGLGEDISFPTAFLQRFGGKVIGIEPNPRSLRYCEARLPPGMELWPNAFWHEAGVKMNFHLPRPQEQLPKGADGVSGSLVDSHEYVGGGESLAVTTVSFQEILASAGREECDVLKLDIEGAEFDVLPRLCREGTLGRAKQVLVEFHHGVTHHVLAETKMIVAAMEDSGYSLTHVEGRNYIFCRKDLG